jgi:hypothetical protein
MEILPHEIDNSFDKNVLTKLIAQNQGETLDENGVIVDLPSDGAYVATADLKRAVSAVIDESPHQTITNDADESVLVAPTVELPPGGGKVVHFSPIVSYAPEPVYDDSTSNTPTSALTSAPPPKGYAPADESQGIVGFIKNNIVIIIILAVLGVYLYTNRPAASQSISSVDVPATRYATQSTSQSTE